MRVSMASVTHANRAHRKRNEDSALGYICYNQGVKFVSPIMQDGKAEFASIAKDAKSDGQSVTVDSAGMIVIDGIAGAKDGHLAAQSAVRVYKRVCEGYLTNRNCKLYTLHERVFTKAAREFSLRFTRNDPSAAVVMGLVTPTSLYVGWAGDTRAYFLERSTGKLHLLTRDHTLLRENLEDRIDINDPVAFDCADHGDSPMYRSLHKKAVPGNLDEHTSEFDKPVANPGDVLILMTDGAYGAFRGCDLQGSRRRLLRRIVERKRSAKKLCEDVVKYALESGSKDNATVGIIKIHKG